MLDITLREIWWKFLDFINWPKPPPEPKTGLMLDAENALRDWSAETLRKDIEREMKAFNQK